MCINILNITFTSILYTMAENISIPWMEKYRPTQFNDIVLDPINKKILNNILDTNYFPNLIFYGPPGTGKTTTIINLINEYKKKHNIKNKGLMIHLNASDDRGIDIIRNQINCFVTSNPLFQVGIKFVILDEVDYMTKTAQHALRYLLQSNINNVRFCLICNYISRIDEGLQNEFIKIRFSKLPTSDILHFLNHISVSEKLNISKQTLACIQQNYKSDIRSMINFMQSIQDIEDITFNVIDGFIWDNITNKIKNQEPLVDINLYIDEISIKYNMDKKSIIKTYLNYLIRNQLEHVNTFFLNFVENIVHYQECKNVYFVNYILTKLRDLYK